MKLSPTTSSPQTLHRIAVPSVMFSLAVGMASCGQTVHGSIPPWIPPPDASLSPFAGVWRSDCRSRVSEVVFHPSLHVGSGWDNFGLNSVLRFNQTGPTTFFFEYLYGGDFPSPDGPFSPIQQWFGEMSGQRIEFRSPQSDQLSTYWNVTLLSGTATLTDGALRAGWTAHFVSRPGGVVYDLTVQFTCTAARFPAR